MTTLTRYLVPCITEQENVPTDYMESRPTRCPNNVDHIIDEANIYAESYISTKTVKIDDTADIKTGGYFRADQHQIIAAPNTVTTYDVGYLYNVGVYSVTFLPSAANIGDTFYIIGLPNTPCGTLTSAVTSGTNLLPIQPYPGFDINILNPGFVINVSDGSTKTDLGFVTGITGSNIILNQNVTADLDLGLQVQFGIPRVLGGKFTTDSPMPLGMAKIGSSALAAGRVFRVYYTNNTNEEKTVNFIVELLY